MTPVGHWEPRCLPHVALIAQKQGRWQAKLRGQLTERNNHSFWTN